MKRVFLVVGIATFSSASGQQNDVFNIEDHLMKKKTGNMIKAPAIKNLWKETDLSKNYKVIVTPKRITPSYGDIPCIKPDMQHFQAMPNPGLGVLRLFDKQPGQIPNVSTTLPRKDIARK